MEIMLTGMEKRCSKDTPLVVLGPIL
jgi:hypothetical protein